MKQWLAWGISSGWRRRPGHVSGAIQALADLHPDSRQVVIRLDDGTLLRRDLATGAEGARFREHRASVVDLTLAAAGGMASGDLAGVVKVWQARSGGGWVCTRTMVIDRPGCPQR